MKNTATLVLALLLAQSLWTQSVAQGSSSGPAPDEVLFTINGENVTVGEFRYIYGKNNKKDEEIDYSREKVEEYLDLYVKFKLKVHEAKSRGLDTTDKFVKEFGTYRKQLAQPYLKDKAVSEKLVKEAYNRMKWELRASHILIDLEEDAFPSDTLVAYNRIMEAYTRVKGGEEFADVAQDFAQYTKDVTLSSRGGDLGYFTAFNMIYPFESKAYAAKVGEVTTPVRTRFGYHIILVTERREYQGEMTAAHIMIRTDLGTGEDQAKLAEAKINDVYDKLANGGNFEDLAKTESQHYASASNGGELRNFNRMSTWLPAQMIEEAYKLQADGDFSKPFKTDFGWHIIKRKKLEPLKEYDDLQHLLKRKVERDSRSQRSEKAAVRRIKNENRFKEKVKFVSAFKKERDSSIIDGTWEPDPDYAYKKKLFMIGKKVYRQSDFVEFLKENQAPEKFKNAEYAIDYYYDKFVAQEVLAYEDNLLEAKYSDFKNLAREYREGILLFEITDNEVWTRAMKDTSGQRVFYNNHTGDYMYKTRADAIIFYCNDKAIADRIRAELKEDNSNLNELFKAMNEENSMTYSFSKDVYEEGKEEVLGLVDWKKGYAVVEDYKGRYVLIKFNEVLDPSAKPFKEIKGLVIADYQDDLEANWIEELRKKYDVQIHQEVLDNLVQ